jgi:hypothetical protein
LHTFLRVVCSQILLVIILALLVDDIEEAQLIDALAGRDDTQPIAQLLLLEELLGPITHGRIVSAINVAQIS